MKNAPAVSSGRIRSAILMTANVSLQASVASVLQSKFLSDVELEVCQRISYVQETINKCKPFLIIVDISLDTLENIAVFLQKVRTNISSASAAIVLVCDSEIQIRLLPMGAEYGISNILLIESVDKSLLPTISSILDEVNKPSSMKSIINRIELAGAKNSLGELDLAALDFYTLFPSEKLACVEYANYCIRRGEWKNAKEVLDKVIQKDQNDLRAINSMVRVLLREHDVDSAVAWLNKAELLSPSNVGRMVLLGDIYREKGIIDAAKGKYNQALAIIPECREAKRGMAIVHLSAGELSDALKLFSESSSQEEIASYFNDAAIISVYKKQFMVAKQLYNAALGALNSHKMRARVIFNIGLAHYKENLAHEAVLHFIRASEEDPEYCRPRATLLKMGIDMPLGANGGLGLAIDVGNGSISRSAVVTPKIIEQIDKQKTWDHWDPATISAHEDFKEEDLDKTIDGLSLKSGQAIKKI